MTYEEKVNKAMSIFENWGGGIATLELIQSVIPRDEAEGMTPSEVYQKVRFSPQYQALLGFKEPHGDGWDAANTVIWEGYWDY